MKKEYVIGTILIALFPLFAYYNTGLQKRIDKKAEKVRVDGLQNRMDTQNNDIRALMIGYGSLKVETDRVSNEVSILRADVKKLYHTGGGSDENE